MVETCTYCGTRGVCEAEHVFPKSWYPDTTPEAVQRLTVPSCAPCNDRWERIEVALSRDLLFVITPKTPEVAGVHDRLLRSMNAATAATPKERRIRAGVAQRMLRTMKWVDPAPGRPRALVRTPAGVYVRASPARQIEPQLLNAFGEKLVRGLHFKMTAERLREVRVARAFLATEPRLSDPELAPFWALLEQSTIDQSLGPGFWFRRVISEEKSAWAFRIWGQITLAVIAELERVHNEDSRA